MSGSARETLFDDIERTDSSPMAYGESVFDFYNRVDRPEWARVRSELDEWYSHYPDDDNDLRNRFQDPRQDQHFGAWWELWVFTFYRHLRYKIAVHPTMPNGKRPDFVITRDGKSTYVECKAMPEKRRSANEALILDCTNEVKNPDFLLELEVDQEGPQTPSCKEIKRQLRYQLELLDADEVIGDREAGKEFPYFNVGVQDWVLTYTAYPVERPHRGVRGRLLALPPTPGAMWIDNVGQIRNAVRAKGRKYAELDKPLEDPLIVALNTWWVPFGDDEDEPFEALFGSTAVAYWQGVQPPVIHAFRRENGYWRRDPPTGTRVSAVLVGHNISPYRSATGVPRMLTNPWSRLPISETDALTTTTATDDGQRVNTEGTLAIDALFGLPSDWPLVDKPRR
jgi:hypothetical protein